jgi:hypothetical protein
MIIYKNIGLDNIRKKKKKEKRINNFGDVCWFFNIDVNQLTKGSDLLTYQENITILKHAFKYIKDSKRFTIV